MPRLSGSKGPRGAEEVEPSNPVAVMIPTAKGYRAGDFLDPAAKSLELLGQLGTLVRAIEEVPAEGEEVCLRGMVGQPI